MRTWLMGATLCCGLCVAAPARADKAAAEALFTQARQLMQEGRLGEACPKLAESLRLDPSPGTSLNLALCLQKQGKTASAWAEYLEAARLAKAAGRDEVEQEARTQAAAIESSLSHLTLEVPKQVTGLEVKRGDTTVASFGTKLPVDPGEHIITATAEGYEPWRGAVTVGPDGDAKTLTVPELRASSAGAVMPPASDSTQPRDASPSTDQDEGDAGGAETAAFGLMGGGVLFTGVGAVFGILALSAHGSASDACPSRANCSQDAVDDRDAAETLANVANVGIGLGLVSLGIGAVMLLTQGGDDSAPGSKTASAWDLTPIAGARFQGAALNGRF